MKSRELILSAVSENQPAKVALPDIHFFESNAKGSTNKFADELSNVGGRIFRVSCYEEIIRIVLETHGDQVRIVSTAPALREIFGDLVSNTVSIHDMKDVELAILNGDFGVAENGAIWMTERDMGFRILPFIAQHLAVIIDSEAIVPTMHDAYELISRTTYEFGAFIAGPSKTADIEQSLVIGAHGPRSMTVFLISNK